MSTAQDSPKRKKQKARRTKQLAEWREKKAGGGPGTAPPAKAKPAKAKPAAKAPAEKKSDKSEAGTKKKA